jgi:Niemann-Pick C1 protein
MKALFSQGSSFIQGVASTKLIAVLAFALSSNSIVQVYFFKVYIFILLLGVFNGLIFLPLMLAFCGPSVVSNLSFHVNALFRTSQST